MSAEKSDAIVLRVVDFSETSCVVTLFTRDFGKISGLAKGARRRKNPFEAAIDVLAFCRIVFLHKTSETLDILTEAKLLRRFKSASTDLQRLYAAYYVVEMLLAMTDEDNPNPELFELAWQTLVDIDEGLPREPCLIQFELRAANMLGQSPALATCVECGKAVDGEGRVFFGLRHGGIFCPDCRRTKKSVVSVSRDAMEILKKMADPKLDWQRIDCPPQAVGELAAIVRRYVAHWLGFQPKMHRYLTGSD
jgi:DNA repair protein RecO (recombination protein O)